MIFINNIKETFLDFPNDEDQAVIVFFEGCSHNCEDCQNTELQIRDDNHAIDCTEAYEQIVNRCSRVKTRKIVFSGGDPLFASNITDLVDMFALISALESEGYQLCVYTGYTIEQVAKLYAMYGVEKSPFPIDMNYNNGYICKMYIPPTYLKCGKYNKHLLNPDMGKSDDSFVLASSNQNFYKRKDIFEFSYKCISIDGILKFR